MGTILVVEDDASLNMGIALALGDGKTQVRQAYDLAGAAVCFAIGVQLCFHGLRL